MVVERLFADEDAARMYRQMIGEAFYQLTIFKYMLGKGVVFFCGVRFIDDEVDIVFG